MNFQFFLTHVQRILTFSDAERVVLSLFFFFFFSFLGLKPHSQRVWLPCAGGGIPSGFFSLGAWPHVWSQACCQCAAVTPGGSLPVWFPPAFGVMEDAVQLLVPPGMWGPRDQSEVHRVSTKAYCFPTLKRCSLQIFECQGLPRMCSSLQAPG